MEIADRLTLRALDPKTELDLFRESYNWRPKKVSPLRPDRMSFESFATADPSQVVMGLFDGSGICAVYLISEGPRRVFETHYSSAKGTPKEYVLNGARRLLAILLDTGAIEVTAYVAQANEPLCRFVEAVGFKKDLLVKFLLQNDTGGDSLAASRIFVKYAARR